MGGFAVHEHFSIIPVTVAAFLCVASASATLPITSPGYPDPTFGIDGAGAFSVRSGYEQVEAIARTPDGRWLISGRAQSAGAANDNIRYLARLQPDGRFDSTFGTQGFLIDQREPGVLAVQGNGRILAATVQAVTGGTRAALERLLPNGARDDAFGVSGGRTVLDATLPAIPNQNLESVGIDNQNRIVASARIHNFNANVSRIEVWRFSADGIPDLTFGTSGHVLLDLPPVAYGSVIRSQPDGKLVVISVCKLSYDAELSRACVARVNADGTPDASFGPNGIRQLIPPPEGSYHAHDLAVASDGKLYVAGAQTTRNPARAMIFRLNSDGTPDASYGQNGLVAPGFIGEFASVFAIRLLGDGRQIAIGTVERSDALNFGFVIRLSAAGDIDSTFGTNGVSPKVTSLPHWFNQGAVLDDGAILAVGSRSGVPDSEDDVDSLLARFVGVETTTPVIEFFNTTLNHYFITADPAEAMSIDAGGSGPGWRRTGKQFKSGGPSRVCRNRGSSDLDPVTGQRRGPNSHVYSIEAAECLQIRADPGWLFESYDFSGWPRLSSNCPAGTTGVYRAYNGRFAQNDSNHRYAVEVDLYNAMLAQGWTGEGIVFCAVQ
jgi:uncharacterized delta-60 repeat protein